MKNGLVLDRVVLLGRTLEEYRRYFALDLDALRGRRVLDVASGVGSFCAEACASGLDVTACDPIYALPPDVIEPRCQADLGHVLDAVRGLPTYRWDFYRSPEHLREFRERAFRTFLADYREHGADRYVTGQLPKLPLADGAFDLTLVSYLLFVYDDHFDYDFHRRAIQELMRVTCGEVRLYPTVTFETRPSAHVAALRRDPALAGLVFEDVATDFEFLRNSNSFLRVRGSAAASRVDCPPSRRAGQSLPDPGRG